jgi:hypothetical protein
MLRFLMLISVIFASVLSLYMTAKHLNQFVFLSWIKLLGLYRAGINFRNYESFWTSGKTCSTGIAPSQGIYLHRTIHKTHTQTHTLKNTHPSVFRMGFEPLLQVMEWYKTVSASDSLTVSVDNCEYYLLFFCHKLWFFRCDRRGHMVA